MNSSNDDRRGAARHVLRTKAKLVFREGLQVDARTLNLSATGMAIVTDGPIVPGTTFMLRCIVPVAGSRAELQAEARVMHCVYSNAEGGFSIGLALVNLSPDATRIIASVLNGR